MKLNLWLLKKIVSEDFVERVLLLLALHEALYDIFPGLQKSFPHGMGVVLLRIIKNDGKFYIMIPASSFHGYPEYGVEVVSSFKKEKGLAAWVTRVEKNTGEKRAFVRTVCYESTHHFNQVFQKLWRQYYRSYCGLKEGLRRIGIEL
jgi:hypothetical protein